MNLPNHTRSGAIIWWTDSTRRRAGGGLYEKRAHEKRMPFYTEVQEVDMG